MRRPVLVYGATITAVAAAVLVRRLLDPILADELPLVTLYGAVALGLWLGGVRAAALAVALGLACNFLILPSRYRLSLDSARDVIGLLGFLLTCSLIIALGESMRRARRRAEHGRERLRREAHLLEESHDAVFAWRLEGPILFWNRGAERLYGYSKQEAIGRICHDLLATEYPAGSRSALDAALARGGEFQGELIHTRKSGERITVESRIQIMRENGEGPFVLETSRDVSERKREQEDLRRAEEAARTVVENVADGIITIDNAGVIQSFNAAAERMFGYPAREVIGRNVNTLMPEPHRSAHDGYLHGYLETGRAKIIGIGREVDGLRKDGSTFPMDLAVSEFRLDQRRYFTGIVRDITERRTLEQRLRERAEQLATEERRKDEFLATLAHELRNPLAPIHNAVQVLMMKNTPDAELKWCRDVIDRHVQHMARLLDDLLDVSRISHGKLELRKERIVLAAVVQSAVETSRPLIEGRRHELTVSLPNEPVYLEADPVRLAQVFSNLLNNAARYTEAGGHILLAAERQGAEVAVRVKDDGIGISPGMMPHIFEIFSQAPEGMERSQGGLGVGLSLVRRLVQLHGGRIEAFSAGRNRGSEFTVRLPAVLKSLIPSVRPGVAEPVARRRLLIVDDVKDAADSLAYLMRLKGHEVRAAYDGGAAITAAAEFRPEVVLLDIGMPKLDGYETCRYIRDQPWGKGMFLVALTGWGQEGDRRRAEEVGFNQHMVKPVDPGAFAALLASLPTAQEARS